MIVNQNKGQNIKSKSGIEVIDMQGWHWKKLVWIYKIKCNLCNKSNWQMNKDYLWKQTTKNCVDNE